MVPLIGAQLLLFLAFLGAQVCDCCEVRNLSGDATVSDCTYQSAREFLLAFKASRWQKATGLSLDFSYAGLRYPDPYGTSNYSSLHEQLVKLTKLEFFSLNMHANLMPQLPVGTLAVFSNPFEALPKLRSLAFNYSGNAADVNLIGRDHSSPNIGLTRCALHVAGLFATTAAIEIDLDLSYTNLQLPVELFSLAPPGATWPLRFLSLDVSGTKITLPVVVFTCNQTQLLYRQSDFRGTSNRTNGTDYHYGVVAPHYPYATSGPTHAMYGNHDTNIETHFAHLSHVSIKAASLRLGDANIRDLAVVLARLPSLDTLALDLTHNNVSDVGLKDLHAATQRMKQLSSLSLDLRHNSFASTTAEACLSDWRQRLQHVEVQTDGFLPIADGAHPSTSAPTSSPSSSTTTLRTTRPTKPTEAPAAPTQAPATTLSSAVAASTALAEQTTSAVQASTTEGMHTDAIEESTTSAAQQQTNVEKPHVQRQDGYYFHPQLALMCLCCVMLGAGYVWWKRSVDPQAFAGLLPDWNGDGAPGPHWTATPGGPDEYPGSTQAQSHDSARTPVFSGDVSGQYREMPLASGHGE